MKSLKLLIVAASAAAALLVGLAPAGAGTPADTLLSGLPAVLGFPLS